MISAWRGLHVNSRTVVSIVDIITYVELSCCVIALILMQYRKQIQQFKPLALFLLTRVTSYAICIPLMKMSDKKIISAHIAYKAYFYVYWSSYVLEAIFGFLIILCIYKLAMAP